MRVGNEELEHGSATEPRRGFWTPEKRTPANLAVLLIIGVLVTIGLTTPIIVLNERAIADGTRVYFGNRIILDEDPIIVGRIIHDANRTRFAGERNHYAGHWYGGANLGLAFLAMAYGVSVLLSTAHNKTPISQYGALHILGFVLLVICLGVMIVAMAAFIQTLSTLSSITDFFHVDFEGREDNSCHFDNVSVCHCGERRLFINVPSCEYVFGTLFDYYNAMVALIFFAGVMDLVMGIFCAIIGNQGSVKPPGQISGMSGPSVVAVTVMEPVVNPGAADPDVSSTPPQYNAAAAKTDEYPTKPV